MPKASAVVLQYRDEEGTASKVSEPPNLILPSQYFSVIRGCGQLTPAAFHAFRGPIEPLDAPRDAQNTERLQWDVRRGMSSILHHPWVPTSRPDAVTVRGFIYDVDTGTLEEVSYPGLMGSIG